MGRAGQAAERWFVCIFMVVDEGTSERDTKKCRLSSLTDSLGLEKPLQYQWLHTYTIICRDRIHFSRRLPMLSVVSPYWRCEFSRIRSQWTLLLISSFTAANLSKIFRTPPFLKEKNAKSAKNILTMIFWGCFYWLINKISRYRLQMMCLSWRSLGSGASFPESENS